MEKKSSTLTVGGLEERALLVGIVGVGAKGVGFGFGAIDTGGGFDPVVDPVADPAAGVDEDEVDGDDPEGRVGEGEMEGE